MSAANEMYELQQRIARLPVGERLRLVESVLVEIRGTDFTDHAAAAREIAAAEAYYAARRRPSGLTGEAKREAG